MRQWAKADKAVCQSGAVCATLWGMSGVLSYPVIKRFCVPVALPLLAAAMLSPAAGFSSAFPLISPAFAAQDNADRKKTRSKGKKARKKREKPERQVKALPRLRGMVPVVAKPPKVAGSAPAAKEAAKAEKAEDDAEKAARKAADRKALLKGADIAAPAELLGTKLLQRLSGAFRRATRAPLRFQAVDPETLNARMKRGLLHAALLAKGANDTDPAGAAMAAFQPVFYVDLYIVGPAKDPADIKGMVSLPDAMRAVAHSRSTFLAAPQGHGLNRLERRVWKEAGIQPIAGRDDWYVAAAGLPAMSTLDLLIKAAQQRAYMIVDRATWLASGLAKRKDRRLRILVRDDPRLQLVYGVTIRRNGGAAPIAATRFREWLTGKAAAGVINGTRIRGARPYLAEHGLRR